MIFYIILSFSVEYIVKPKMVGTQVKMHTLLVFLSIIGGLSVYGILGIIYGPLIITAFLTLSDIYLKRYDPAHSAHVNRTEQLFPDERIRKVNGNHIPAGHHIP